MKRLGGLWDQIVSWTNLLAAARKARRGKRRRPVVTRFEMQREWHLLDLRDELMAGSYQPGTFTTHRILAPKPRLISAAPYRDRVVHHAVMNILAPCLDQRLHPGCFACRVGKGTHAAAKHVQTLARQWPFVWQADIQSFFPSIDHGILKAQLRRLLKDNRLLDLLDTLIDASNPQDPVTVYYPGDDLFTPFTRRRGLPIGNLTSQWLANWYLNGLDHLITSHLRLGHYARYCDDFVVFGRTPGELQDARCQVVEHLASLRLRLHPRKNRISPVRAGLCFVGYRIWPGSLRVWRVTIRRFFQRLRVMRCLLAAGALSRATVSCRVHGFLGHVIPVFGDRFRAVVARRWLQLGKPAKQEEKIKNRIQT